MVKDAYIRTRKIRRIRENQRAIGSINSPRIDADAADQRGLRRAVFKCHREGNEMLQKGTPLPHLRQRVH
jgi:hypothetical protein